MTGDPRTTGAGALAARAVALLVAAPVLLVMALLGGSARLVAGPAGFLAFTGSLGSAGSVSPAVTVAGPPVAVGPRAFTDALRFVYVPGHGATARRRAVPAPVNSSPPSAVLPPMGAAAMLVLLVAWRTERAEADDRPRRPVARAPPGVRAAAPLAAG